MESKFFKCKKLLEVLMSTNGTNEYFSFFDPIR